MVVVVTSEHLGMGIEQHLRPSTHTSFMAGKRVRQGQLTSQSRGRLPGYSSIHGVQHRQKPRRKAPLVPLA